MFQVLAYDRVLDKWLRVASFRSGAEANDYADRLGPRVRIVRPFQ